MFWNLPHGLQKLNQCAHTVTSFFHKAHNILSVICIIKLVRKYNKTNRKKTNVNRAYFHERLLHLPYLHHETTNTISLKEAALQLKDKKMLSKKSLHILERKRYVFCTCERSQGSGTSPLFLKPSLSSTISKIGQNFVTTFFSLCKCHK